jgi:hypothetical protein
MVKITALLVLLPAACSPSFEAQHETGQETSDGASELEAAREDADAAGDGRDADGAGLDTIDGAVVSEEADHDQAAEADATAEESALDAGPDSDGHAVDTATEDVKSESCTLDTCVAHGYSCGSIPDGCGSTVTCGPPVIHYTPSDWPFTEQGYGCSATHPHAWGCTTQGAGPQPYAGCIPWGPSNPAWCCTQS